MNAKLVELIERAEKLNDSACNQPEFKAWKNDAIIFLKKQYGDNSHEASSFDKIEYYNFYGVKAMINNDKMEKNKAKKIIFQKGLKTAILYLKNYNSNDNAHEKDSKKDHINNKNIFIVHGRDDGIKAQIVNFLLKLNLNPIILNEQANKGLTIIEKFEKYSYVNVAIALFTGDDLGKFKNDTEYEKRARQNVIFETGYFIGKLGRKYTIILLEKGLKMPSDLDGYIYFEIDEKQRWHIDVAKELNGMGLDIDLNHL